jgi:hypothetical protein
MNVLGNHNEHLHSRNGVKACMTEKQNSFAADSESLTFARSLIVSVFPEPAGPAVQPPRFRLRAPVRVSQQRSVRGVITSLGEQPKYS